MKEIKKSEAKGGIRINGIEIQERKRKIKEGLKRGRRKKERNKGGNTESC